VNERDALCAACRGEDRVPECVKPYCGRPANHAGRHSNIHFCDEWDDPLRPDNQELA